jgi:hypothetical protein
MNQTQRRFTGLAVMAAACLILNGILTAQSGKPPQNTMGAVGITIFVEANFHGANANFTADMPDLRKVGMNDRVDSIRIGRGELWQVCEDINFKGRCQIFSGDEGDLNRVGWGGLISSLRPVKEGGRGGYPVAPPPRPHLVLFDAIDFRGESLVVYENTPALRGFVNRAGSVKVYGGAWQICDAIDFWGRCEMVTASVPDLARLGFRNKISSVRMRPR